MPFARLTTGRTYHYLDQKPGQSGKQPLLCVHGFPDFSYGWRNQISHWVARGHRVIAPDMLGYGKTDMPVETSAYSTKRLCDDLAALLDHLTVQKAVVIGHDWGAFIAGRFALWHPERLLALAILSLPYTPPSRYYVSLDEVVQRYPSFGYQLYFASEQSTAEIDARLPLFFQMAFSSSFWPLLPGEFQRHLLKGAEPGTSILSDQELDHYISSFQRGMLGALSYYRTSRFRFEEERDAALPSKLPVDLPVLFLYGTKDAACPPVALGNMGKFIDKLQIVSIPDVGHWIMVQAPEIVTQVILDWVPSALDPRAPARL